MISSTALLVDSAYMRALAVMPVLCLWGGYVGTAMDLDGVCPAKEAP